MLNQSHLHFGINLYDEVKQEYLIINNYDFCLAFWRKTYKYKLSTFSRAHGVVRKNRNDDLTLGSMQKHLISILRLKPSKPP